MFLCKKSTVSRRQKVQKPGGTSCEITTPTHDVERGKDNIMKNSQHYREEKRPK